MISVDVESSGFGVLSAGMFFTKEKDDSVKFRIALDNGFLFYLTLIFTEDEGLGDKSELRLNGDKERQSITLNCVNFKDTGTGTTKPLELATYQGKSILMHFWSYRMSEKAPRKIEYTLYQER